MRARLVDDLQRRARLPGLGADSLWPLWCTVLLGIHRGGRSKIKALRQVSDALGANPAMADRLLPILAVAIRSVRTAEARFGLAAVVRATALNPDVEGAVRRMLPELRLDVEAVA